MWVLGLLSNAFGSYFTFVAEVNEDSGNEGDPTDASTKKEYLKQKRDQVRAPKQNDLIPLYFMRESDIKKMVDLVMAKKVSLKSTKSTKKLAILINLGKACYIEKRRTLIKKLYKDLVGARNFGGIVFHVSSSQIWLEWLRLQPL